MMQLATNTRLRLSIMLVSIPWVSPGTWSQSLEICNLPDPPTVVVSVPGVLVSCTDETVPFHIYYAQGTKRIQFTIKVPPSYRWPIGLEPEHGGGYSGLSPFLTQQASL